VSRSGRVTPTHPGPVRMAGPRVMVVVLVLGVVCAAFNGGAVPSAVAEPTAVESHKPPAHWDERVADLVQFVERTRGLDFKHAVPVRFLMEQQFKKEVAADQGDLSRQDKAEVEKQAGLLRALGLIQGDAKKLLEDTSAVDVAEALAFYDPDEKRVVIRGKALDVSTRVTVVHELTHVLQDQYFDLNKLEDNADNAAGRVDALAEGDATRVEDSYVSTLSESDRAAYEEASDQQADAAEGGLPRDVPATVEVMGEAPYSLGPAFVEAVAHARGERGVDAAFRTLPASDKQILSPSKYLQGENPMPVEAPRLAAGETRLGKDDTLGAFGLYLMLAGRVDPAVALPTIDAWGGDAMVEFTRGGKVCIRAAVAGSNPAGVETIAGALDQWAALGPRDAASVDRANGGAVTVTACDPGRPPADANIIAAGYVLAARASALSSEIAGGKPLDAARCVADRAPFDPDLRSFLLGSNGTHEDLGEFADKVKAVEAACGV
jgi:hypothetical protein